MLLTKTQVNKSPVGQSGLRSRIQALKGKGRPLSQSERTFFEPRFGHDFSNVRIHQGEQESDISRSINARAFTLGNNIAFGSGQYQAHSIEGRRLLSHELTHVVQQSNGQASGCHSSVIQMHPAPNPSNYITHIFVDLTRQSVWWIYSNGSVSNNHLTSTGAGICSNNRNVCYSGNTSGNACTPVGGPFPVTGNRHHSQYRHFIDFGRSSIGFHYYSKVDGCPWSHGCVRLREDAIDLLHEGVLTDQQAARTSPRVSPTQVMVFGIPNIVRCWTTANGGRCYIRNASGTGHTNQSCARYDCWPIGDFPQPDMSEGATKTV